MSTLEALGHGLRLMNTGRRAKMNIDTKLVLQYKVMWPVTSLLLSFPQSRVAMFGAYVLQFANSGAVGKLE